MAGHVYNFTDEEEAWNFVALHRLGGEFVGIDPAGGDFGFLVTFRSRRCNGPRMRLLLKLSQSSVGPSGGSVQFQPAVRHSVGQDIPKSRSQSRHSSRCLRIAEDRGECASRSQVNPDLTWFFPVRRNLQDHGAAEAAMGDQHFFPELLPVARGDHVGGNPGKVAVAGTVFRFEHQGHESGPGFANLESELARQVIAKGSSADLWDR